MTRYYLVKIDGDLRPKDAVEAFRDALDFYTEDDVRRAFIADVNNGDLTDIVDKAELFPTETATIDNGGTQ